MSAIADEPADPFLWLEDVHSPAALAWAAERTAETEAAFDSAERSALQTRLQGILDDPDRLVPPSRHGEWMYELRRDADHPRGVWRRCDRAAFRAGSAAWETILDVDALGAAEGTRWTWAGASHGPAGSGRALVRLSPDGGDAVVVREFDLDERAFVADTAFAVGPAKSFAAWLDVDTLLVATEGDGGATTASGYPRTARVWRRGQALADAVEVMAGASEDVGVFVGADRTDGRRTAMIRVAHDFYRTTSHAWAFAPSAPYAPKRIDVPDDADVDVHGRFILVRTTTPWTLDGVELTPGTLLVGDLDAVLDGDVAGLRAVFSPTEHRVLEGWAWTRSRLVLTLLEDVRTRLLSIDPAGAADPFEILTGVGDDDALSVGVATSDPDEDDELWLLARGFLTPSTLVVTDAAEPVAHVVDRAKAVFETEGLRVEQRWATSADGTRVPYFEVGPAYRSGPLPVLMSGYGGFEHALTPEYPTIVGPAWLERGRVFVVAGIRGGGEFGPSWHRAALRERRHRAYEDFVAVARDLVGRGVSTADRIGCHGRSNGGLLVGNMLTLYPEDFGAIVCGVPLLDMRRYTRLSAGASWIAEYGDPDDADDWAFIRTFSPYHLVDPQRTYPPSLFYAATSDDRVGPVQARKMAARLLAETGAETHYLEPDEGGHAGSVDNAATAALHATIHAFLEDVLVRRTD